MGITGIYKNRGHFLLTAITALSSLFFFVIIWPFILTIALAGIFAMGLTPLVEKIRSKYGLARMRIFISIVIISLFAFFTLGSLCIFRIYDLTFGDDRDKSVAVLNSIREKVGSTSGLIENFAQSTLRTFGITTTPRIGQQAQILMKRFGEWSLHAAGTFFSKLPIFSMHFVVFILMLIVFFRYGKTFYGLILRSKLVTTDELATVTELLQTSGGSMLSTNLIVGGIQASVVTTGAAIVGLNEWSIIFTLTFICSFIPVIGAAPIGLLLSGLSFSLGNVGSGVFMVFVSVVSGTIDNIIRPYLVARSEENLNAFVSLVGIIGAITVFGFHGIFLGPFVMSVASSAVPKLLETLESKAVA